MKEPTRDKSPQKLPTLRVVKKRITERAPLLTIEAASKRVVLKDKKWMSTSEIVPEKCKKEEPTSKTDDHQFLTVNDSSEEMNT